MQVKEAADEYLASKKRDKPHTKVEHKRILYLFSAWCESRKTQLENLKAKHVGEYTEHLYASMKSKQGGAPSSHTVALHIRVIKAFLNWCIRDEDFEEFVRSSTVQRIENPRMEHKILDTFTQAQIKELFRVCEREMSEHLAQRDRAIIALLLDTGIRAAELCALRLDQIDVSPNDPHIRVFGKGDKWREIGLGDRSRKELWRYIHRYREEDRGTASPVFLTRRGEPMQVGTLQDMVERLGEWAGIEGVRCSPHTFRHTYAVSYIRNGGDIYRLSKLMGHTSVHITENYLKSFTQSDARRGAINPLDRA